MTNEPMSLEQVRGILNDQAFKSEPDTSWYLAARDAIDARLTSREEKGDAVADENGLSFVDGLGWVVQCQKAVEYVNTLQPWRTHRAAQEAAQPISLDAATQAQVASVLLQHGTESQKHEVAARLLRPKPTKQAAQPMGGVTDAMVDRAFKAFDPVGWEVTGGDSRCDYKARIRAALTAALAAQPHAEAKVGDSETLTFEQWYMTNAFDYERNPMGSRECALQRKAWNGAVRNLPAVGVPDGWKLVPIEPTPEMLKACDTVIQGYGAKLTWGRMVSAVPEVPHG